MVGKYLHLKLLYSCIIFNDKHRRATKIGKGKGREWKDTGEGVQMYEIMVNLSGISTGPASQSWLQLIWTSLYISMYHSDFMLCHDVT